MCERKCRIGDVANRSGCGQNDVSDLGIRGIAWRTLPDWGGSLRMALPSLILAFTRRIVVCPAYLLQAVTRAFLLSLLYTQKTYRQGRLSCFFVFCVYNY